MPSSKKQNPSAKSLRAPILAVAIAFVAAIACGCAGKTPPAPPAKAGAPGPSTLSEKVQRKISARVIGDIPNQGKLKEIRQRGILRVALPPEDPPFQYTGKLIRQPAGFNVALAAAIANVLEVKPNITILKQKEINRINDAAGSDERYDIVFRTHGSTICAAKRSIPYFYIAEDRSWRTLCVSGDTDTLKKAVENTLAYFAETGIYTSLYSDYFK